MLFGIRAEVSAQIICSLRSICNVAHKVLEFMLHSAELQISLFR